MPTEVKNLSTKLDDTLLPKPWCGSLKLPQVFHIWQ